MDTKRSDCPVWRTSAPVRGGHDPRDDQAGGLVCGKEKTGKANQINTTTVSRSVKDWPRYFTRKRMCMGNDISSCCCSWLARESETYRAVFSMSDAAADEFVQGSECSKAPGKLVDPNPDNDPFRKLPVRRPIFGPRYPRIREKGFLIKKWDVYFLLGQFMTEQFSQTCSLSFSRPKGIVSPHWHNHPAGVFVCNC